MLGYDSTYDGVYQYTPVIGKSICVFLTLMKQNGFSVVSCVIRDSSYPDIIEEMNKNVAELL